MPSVLWCCWLGDKKGPVKTEWLDAGVVICLERGAYLHMAQLMPLPLTVSCFSKLQIGFIFLVLAHLGSPGKGPLNVCVCVFQNDIWEAGGGCVGWREGSVPAAMQRDITEHPLLWVQHRRWVGGGRPYADAETDRPRGSAHCQAWCTLNKPLIWDVFSWCLQKAYAIFFNLHNA